MTSPLDPAAQRVVANFLDADGRLLTIPSKRAKLLVVLDHYWRSGGTVDV